MKLPAPSEQLETFEIEFDHGYPLIRGGTEHPIIGPYVIADYLARGLVRESEVVARAAIKRMDDFRFYYSINGRPAPSRNHDPHYSGLTQARYLDAFSMLAEATGKKVWKDAARRTFETLTIDVDQGGVLLDGEIILETPMPNASDIVLNGWLTAAVHVCEYARHEPAAVELAEKTCAALERLLPFFDVPEVANSRYASCGPGSFRLVFSDRCHLAGAWIERAKHPRFAASRIEPGSDIGGKWRDGIAWSSLTVAELNLVLDSLARAETLELSIWADRPASVALQYEHADYHPGCAAPPHGRFLEVGSDIFKRGENRISLPIPREIARELAYPTNFLKDGKRNAYHWIHVERLKQLHALTGSDVFADFAATWEEYTRAWPSMEVYADYCLEPAEGILFGDCPKHWETACA